MAMRPTSGGRGARGGRSGVVRPIYEDLMWPTGGGRGARGGRSGVVRPIYEDLMWPTGGGRGARGGQSGMVRPVYEDFKPPSEWQHDDESHILNISLPGFMEEQVKVSRENKNTIKVSGERLVAGNKLSRFVEDFQVPENGEMNSIRAKYQGGILNITIPKMERQKSLEAVPSRPKSYNIQKQPALQKGQDKISPEASTSQTKDERSLQQKTSDDQRTTQGREGDGKQHVPQNDHDKDFPTYKSGKPAVVQDANEENSEHKEKDIATERQDDVKEKIEYDEQKKSADSKELPEVETAKKMKVETDGATGIPETKPENKESLGAFREKKYKAVNGLAELNEERQLLVNMGIAMLAIVALTAYFTYKFASGKDKN